jgi:CBS domain-containing protein
MEKKMNIGNIIGRDSTNAVTIDISWGLHAAAVLMMRHHTAVLVVTDRGKAVGMVSERDLVGALADTGSRVASTSIREVMTKPVIAISASESVMSAMALMTERRLRYLPVFDNGQLIAVVNMGDLIKYRLREIELEAMSSTPRRSRAARDDAFFVSDQPRLLPHSREAA